MTKFKPIQPRPFIRINPMVKKLRIKYFPTGLELLQDIQCGICKNWKGYKTDGYDLFYKNDCRCDVNFVQKKSLKPLEVRHWNELVTYDYNKNKNSRL